MPRQPRYPLNGYPLSRAEIRKFQGRGAMQEFLDFYAAADVLFNKDDFDVDTLNTFWTAVAGGGGASQANFAVNVQEDGWIRGTTGTANGDTTTTTLISALNFYGDRNAGCMIRWKPITAITETRIELGFVDVVPGSTKSVVNSLTTPTVNTSVVDAALSVYDHTSTTTTNELVTIGSSIAAAKTTHTPPTAIAATTKNVIRIQLVTNFVYLWMDGVLQVSHATPGTDYVEGGDALALFALIRASDATSKSLDIDYFMWWKNRN
jgi:hypothetical protein